MGIDRNRLEYRHRINRVQDYIREHRADELTLDRLAQVAAFSPFHFHRIFKAITGENVKEFVQRTRLEAAASQLTTRADSDILSIAIDNGFSSASAFARAFKERFGMTATAWRTRCEPIDRKDGQALRNDGETDSKACKAAPRGDAHDPDGLGAAADGQEDTMNVSIKTLPTYHLAYMRHVGPYGAEGIPRTWQQLQRWASARDLWTSDRLCLGIALDDPMVTEPSKCRYDAAIVVPADFVGDQAVNVIDHPGGKHAMAEFVGSSKDIGRAWSELFGRWLPQSGYQPDNRVCFELYSGEAWDGKTDLFRCDLCVPVRPL